MSSDASSIERKFRLAVVVSHPTQYYSPWFQQLAKEEALDLKVFYLWSFGVTQQTDRQFGQTIKWDVDLLSGYAHEFVPNISSDPGTHHFYGLNNPTLHDRLGAYAPSAVLLFGYAYRAHLGLLLRPPAPLIFRGDSHLLGHARPSWLKRIALSWIYSRFAAVTYVGQANQAYFRAFGVREAKLHFAPHCVDAACFVRNQAVAHAAKDRRESLGISFKKVILFAGKYIPDKQPSALLEAFMRLAPANTALVFVGAGSEHASLVARAAALPPGSVHFLPFANQSEMPSIYAMADIFVLPSNGLYETWGLAVNEAMHLGVPCLVSDRVGCQADLVTEGQTGWVFKAGDVDALTAALARALATINREPTALLANIARRISGYTYAQATAGLKTALAAVHP